MKESGIQKTEHTCIRELRCVLKDDERRDRGEKLAGILVEIADKKEQAKAAARAYRTEVEAMQCTGSKLRDAVLYGSEIRGVPCRWFINWDTGKRVLVREDTSEEVMKEDIPDAWRQGRIDDLLDD